MAVTENFERQNRQQIENANREEVESTDIEEVTVSQSEWKSVYTEKSTNTKRYAPGYGTGNRSSSEAGFSDFDLQNSNGNPVDGQFRWVIYESEDQDVPMAILDGISTRSQRASVSESLRDKQMVAGRTPRASQDRVLALEFKASSGSDGDTLDQANSDSEQGLPYSKYRV